MIAKDEARYKSAVWKGRELRSGPQKAERVREQPKKALAIIEHVLFG